MSNSSNPANNSPDLSTRSEGSRTITDTAAETLYSNQGSITAPIREDYRQAAPGSSAAAPATDPAAAPPGATPPAEPRSPADVLYPNAGTGLGNAIAKRPAAPPAATPTAAAKPTNAATPEGARTADDAEPNDDEPAADDGDPNDDGEKKPDAKAEPKTEPEPIEELPAALKDTIWHGAQPSSTTDYEASLAPDGIKFEKGEHFEPVKAALHAGGVPITAAIAVANIVKDFARNGASSHTAESATKTLEAWDPGNSATHIANARAMVDRMAKGWPQLRAELAKTNLDNSPRLVYALSQIYARRSR